MLNEPKFDVARFLPSLQNIADADYQVVIKEARDSSRSGVMMVDQVERSEVTKLFETTWMPQKVRSTVTVQQSLPPAIMALDQEEIKEIRKAFLMRVMEAVSDDNKDAEKLNQLLRKYRDYHCMIQDAIKSKALEHAAKNESCGGPIMVVLSTQFNAQLCDNISTAVLKHAAGNWTHGEKIMNILVKTCEEKIRNLLSTDVIRSAAENQEFGGPILKLLRTACERKVQQLTDEILKDKNPMHAKIRHSLEERMNEIEPGIVSGHRVRDAVRNESHRRRSTRLGWRDS